MIQCKICQAESIPVYQAGIYNMYQCKKCALAFVHPLPSDDFLNDFYNNFHLKLTEGGLYENWDQRMNADFPSKAMKVQSRVDSHSKILDVGCGKGFFVLQCRNLGLQVDGIDVSKSAIEYAKNEFNLDLFCGDIGEFPELENQYDVVTFWATIEHLKYPFETLVTLRRVLKPGGKLFLDTGIGNDWLDKMLPGVNQWYDPPQHLSVFSKDSLEILLSNAGFTIESIDSMYERSHFRRVLRFLRGFLYAVSLRAITIIFRTNFTRSVTFSRFPVGNLISIVATKNTD